jgi:hypothetical protein
VRDDFAIFILTHGRADNVQTFKALRRFCYTGKIYIVIDDEDRAGDAYRREFGDAVLVFSKEKIAAEFDEGDSFGDRRSVFYARNACWELARNVGVRYFMECDDDYTSFYLRTDRRGEGSHVRAECLDIVIEEMLAYFETIPALSIAMSQGGDHIAGPGGVTIRKAMNTFLCDVERPFAFVGRVNEDVNTYVSLSRLGGVFLTLPRIEVIQSQTQSNPGGMTELYLDTGTYLKSFYSVMYCPSAVKISALYYFTKKVRIHHSIHWPSAAAQIVRETHRKPDRPTSSKGRPHGNARTKAEAHEAAAA